MKSQRRVRRRIEGNRLYDRAEVMQLLGMERRALAKAVRSQGLRFARPGLRYVFLGSWLLDWLGEVSQRRQPDAERNGE